jgi:hypothetical protein
MISFMHAPGTPIAAGPAKEPDAYQPFSLHECRSG